MLSLASALRLPSQSQYAQPPQRTTRPQLQQQQELFMEVQIVLLRHLKVTPNDRNQS